MSLPPMINKACAGYYFTIIFLPFWIYNPFCGFTERCRPWRLKIVSFVFVCSIFWGSGMPVASISTMLSKFLHPLTALYFILHPLGTNRVISEVSNNSKASVSKGFSMCDTTETKFMHCPKAPLPIEVTVLGISTLTRL